LISIKPYVGFRTTKGDGVEKARKWCQFVLAARFALQEGLDGVRGRGGKRRAEKGGREEEKRWRERNVL
jgi:hypothetical protein